MVSILHLNDEEAFNKGVEDYDDGVPLSKNPYPKKTFKYESWIQGWYKGRKVSEY